MVADSSAYLLKLFPPFGTFPSTALYINAVRGNTERGFHTPKTSVRKYSLDFCTEQGALPKLWVALGRDFTSMEKMNAADNVFNVHLRIGCKTDLYHWNWKASSLIWNTLTIHWQYCNQYWIESFLIDYYTHSLIFLVFKYTVY